MTADTILHIVTAASVWVGEGAVVVLKSFEPSRVAPEALQQPLLLRNVAVAPGVCRTSVNYPPSPLSLLCSVGRWKRTKRGNF